MAHTTKYRNPQRGYARADHRLTTQTLESELGGEWGSQDEQQFEAMPEDSIAKLMLGKVAHAAAPAAAAAAASDAADGGRMIAANCVTHVVRGTAATTPAAPVGKPSLLDRLFAMLRRRR